MKRIFILTLSLIIIVISFCGCKNKSKSTSENEKAKTDISTENMDFSFSDRDLTYTYNEAETKTVSENEETVKITSAGTYKISGKHKQISIEANDTDKIQLVLNNTEISNSEGPAIYIKSADKVFITVPADTESTVTDGSEYSADYSNTNADGCIFSKSDLTLNGLGRLNINGNYKCGVVSKDDLILCGITLKIKSSGAGIEGKDCVKIKDADITADTGGDGIKSTNTEKSDRGFVYIESVKLNLLAANDGIDAVSTVKISDGKLNITTNGGADNSETKNNNIFGNGKKGFNNTETANTESRKGIKCDSLIIIDSGEFELNTSDDAIHSNTDVQISCGDFKLSSGDDGIHADDALIINGGKIEISRSYEGLEGTSVNITGGEISIASDDDGINAAGGNDSSALGRPGANSFNSNSDAVISISGGYITVNSTGDGVDSNGSIKISGGVLLVSGPSDNGNGALDYESEALITGGAAILCGSSGMAQSFSASLEQCSFMYTLNSTVSGGKTVSVTDNGGNVIASFLSSKNFSNIVVSTPKLKQGAAYKLNIGGTVKECDANGFTENSTLQNADESYDIELTSVSTVIGSGGRMGGMRGNRPEQNGNPNEKIPDDIPPDMGSRQPKNKDFVN